MAGNANSGRTNKPAALHILHGDPSKLGANELKRRDDVQYPPMEDLTAPAYFSEFEKECWRELAERFKATRVLSTMDGWALELLVETYAEWREHKRTLDLEGYTQIQVTPTTGASKEVAHPVTALKQKAHAQCVQLLLQFGWTPAARTKTQQLSRLEDDPVGVKFGSRPAV